VAFSIEIEKRCLRELKKIDKKIAERAFAIIETILAEDPFQGKPLTGKYKGLFSFRFSDYRVIYEIDKRRVVIVALRIAHRKKVYDGL